MDGISWSANAEISMKVSPEISFRDGSDGSEVCREGVIGRSRLFVVRFGSLGIADVGGNTNGVIVSEMANA